MIEETKIKPSGQPDASEKEETKSKLKNSFGMDRLEASL